MSKHLGRFPISISAKKQVTPDVPKQISELGSSCVINYSENGIQKNHIITYEDIKDGAFVGKGQFGVVRKLYNKATNLNFAVKMVKAKGTQSVDSRNSDIMDLAVLKTIGDGCDSIIKFYGAIFAEDCVWILTELMDSCLDKFYKKSFALNLTMSERFLSKVAHSVLLGLQYLKFIKMLHRDIKPSNILINLKGNIKLCDFGISGYTKNSYCVTFKGCERYMAPEKIKSMDSSGYKITSDIWSLGISLIEISTGKHPYEGLNLFRQIFLLTEDSPKLDRAKNSEEFCDFVNQCLVKLACNRADFPNILEHVFILKYQNQQNDLPYIKQVINEVSK